MDNLELFLSVLAIIGYFITFAKYLSDRKAEAERRAKDNQRLEDAIQNLARRVDSHNRYAEMFREYGEDIAFIRGQLENKK